MESRPRENVVPSRTFFSNAMDSPSFQFLESVAYYEVASGNY